MLKSFIRTTVWSLVVVFALTNPVAAQQPKPSAEVDRATEATNVLNEIMNIPENAIPEELMARAHGIAVIPHVVKGAFGIGGQWGKGLMSQRSETGRWSQPAFIEIGGGSFGFQIGVQASDIVLVFTDESGIKGLLKGKVKLGADASATAGPVGEKRKWVRTYFSDPEFLRTHAVKACSRGSHWTAPLSVLMATRTGKFMEKR
jgi:lipid-binding SYLF domain-containing protein